MNASLWRVFEEQSLENKYYLQRLLGVGSYGGVFLADEVVADRLVRQVAVKLMETDPDDRNAQNGQMQELIAATNLDHPALLRSFTCGQCELNRVPLLYLITELATETLDARLQSGALTVAEAHTVALALASALHYLQEQAIPLVHRDVKPANLMRVGSRWKLGDFGLLRAVDRQNPMQTGAMVGTAAYAPPESYRGIIGPAWDIWSLGVLLVEALTGKLPFEGTTPHQLMIAVSSEEPRLPADLPAPFDRIVRGCLTRSTASRWTASQVLAALAAPLEIRPTVQVNREEREAGTGEQEKAEEVRSGPSGYLEIGIYPTAIVASESLSARRGARGTGTSAPLASVKVEAVSEGFYARLSAATSESGAAVEEERIVSASGEGHYRTLTEAIRSAPDDAEITVLPGIYLEQLVLDRPIRIVGRGDRSRIIIETKGRPCIEMRTARAEVCNLTLISRAELNHSYLSSTAIPHRHPAVEITQGVLTLDCCIISCTSTVCVAVVGAGTSPVLRDCDLREGKSGGITFAEGAGGTLWGCSVYNNGGPGIAILSGALPRIVGCHICNGKEAGLHIEQATGTVEDCDIEGNAGNGIFLGVGADPVIRDCRIFNGLQVGVAARDGCRGTLEECDLYGQVLSNITIAQGASTMVRRCRIHDGQSNGIWVSQNGLGTIEGCEIYGNAFAGIKVSHGGNPVVRTTTLRDGKRMGILVMDHARVSLLDCSIAGHVQAGVQVDPGANLSMRRCIVRDGKETGVWMAGDGLLEECELFGNARAGIEIRQGGKPTVRQCRIHDGLYVGVLAHNNAQAILEDSDLYANTLPNLAIGDGSRVDVRSCRIYESKQVGVVYWNQARGITEDCDIYDNALDGVCIRHGSDPLLRNCRINGNGLNGVHALERGEGAVMRCDLTGNGRDALFIEANCKTQSIENVL